MDEVFKHYKEINKIDHMITYDEAFVAVMNEIDKYITTFGIDNYILFMKAKLYMKFGELDEALDNLVLLTRYSGKSFLMMAIASFGLEKYKNAIFYGKAALGYGLKSSDEIRLQDIIRYSKYKLGIICDNEYNEWLRRYITYDEKFAINHIKSHMNENFSKELHSIFSSHINIEELFYKMRELIENAKYYYTDYLMDSYLFKYDNIGYINEEHTDYLNIIVMHGTNNIWTMYPFPKSNIKLNTVVNNIPIYLKGEIEEIYEPKVKRKSAIEKFNDRYKLN